MKTLLIGLIFLTALISGCSGSNPGNPIFAQVEQFIDGMTAQSYSWGFKIHQRFTKKSRSRHYAYHKIRK